MNPCKRMMVTAVGLGKDGSVAVRTNYNETECTGIEGKCGCIHAEIALLKVMPDPEMVVLSLSPCLDCAKALHKAGVVEVSYFWPYRKQDGINYLKLHGIQVSCMTERVEMGDESFDD